MGQRGQSWWQFALSAQKFEVLPGGGCGPSPLGPPPTTLDILSSKDLKEFEFLIAGILKEWRME